MVVDLLFVVAGLALLVRAADRFVVAAARIADAANVPPIVIGAALIGFGTSLPEMLVSGLASSQGEPELAIGNIVGSNLANLTLVLGAASLLVPPAVVPRVLKREAPIALLAAVVFAVLVQNGLTRPEGVVLAAGLGVALWLILRASEGESEAVALLEEVKELEHVEGAISIPRELLIGLVGLIGTLAGAQLLVHGATDIAEELGLSGGFIGLTLVAVGTSLPELVTGIQSVRRGEESLLIGNVLGSNVFNSFAVGGITALVAPAAVTDASLVVTATGLMVGVAVLATIFLATGPRITRLKGGVLLAVYFLSLPFLA